ncbi:hypothetical protein F949_01647 [Acinetobacter junii NIPH 182]|uniref:phage tail tube protein n=1 Tax=Acinetobacter junii TaxID=40215 RepID=UPI0002CE8746|nr:hypothetical protein [Acinetobacter junii]ENV64258.1 hypothetical protein F949_01647 [Acinetobacter junii NIPH 182]
MAKEYIYLQGKFYLSKIANGVAGAMRFIGNVPEFEIAITADLIEHTESTSGNSTTDFTMVNTTGVEFSGQIEEINPENMEYILSGTNHEIASTTVTDLNIGTVVAGDEIMLDGYNLSAVSFKDSTAIPVTVDPSKYTLDAKFGTVIFNDVTGLTMPLKASFTTGAVTQTTIATDLEEEYELFFKGINKATKKHMAVRLWRTKKSPETTFPLIHNDLGQYQIQGQALSDVSKESDPALGVYGHIVIIPAAA